MKESEFEMFYRLREMLSEVVYIHATPPGDNNYILFDNYDMQTEENNCNNKNNKNKNKNSNNNMYDMILDLYAFPCVKILRITSIRICKIKSLINLRNHLQTVVINNSLNDFFTLFSPDPMDDISQQSQFLKDKYQGISVWVFFLFLFFIFFEIRVCVIDCGICVCMCVYA